MPTPDDEPAPAHDLLAQIYAALRAAAAQQLAHERASHTLTATALVHEAWLRLAPEREVPFANRAHFYATAVEAMRRVLLDHGKARGRQKRGGARSRVPLDLDAPLDLSTDERLDDYLDLDAALERLRGEDPRLAEAVRLRVFAGLSVPEIAAVLRVSERTVKSDWAFARAWLTRQLGGRELPS